MYSKELEAIIEAALADGVLTDKEREVLHRRAAQEGVDADELDVIIEGKLAKMKQEKDWLRPEPPTTEKRGNVVKCPNCGVPIQAGATKCTECGYVFTNVKANSSMERLQKGIAEITDKYNVLISKASDKAAAGYTCSEKDLVRKDMKKAIKNFIRNFPIPSSKEDLIEFTTAMNGNRMQTGDFESAYRAKYIECITKIKTFFPDDPQMMNLVNSTDSKWARIPTIWKFLIPILVIAFLILIFAGISRHSSANRNEQATQQGKAQCDSLCSIIDNLPTPNSENYKDVEKVLLSLAWTNIDCPDEETDIKVNGNITLNDNVLEDIFGPSSKSLDQLRKAENSFKASYLARKRAYAQMIYSVYLDLHQGDEDEAEKYAPKSISNSRSYIEN